MSSIIAKDHNPRRDGAGYWRSLEELADTPAYRALSQGEFAGAEDLWRPPNVSRRRLLKLLGASIALAGVTGCSRQPDEHIVPYVNMPEHMVPGQSRFYATATTVAGYAHGLLAESHEGRPTKLEGNPDHPSMLGACDAISQASVLSLYDPDRSAAVRHQGSISSFGACLSQLQARQRDWDANGGRGLCLLTATTTSPSEVARMQALRNRWPQARWFVHEPVDRRSVYEGSRRLFGEALEPRYRFGRASVVLTLDADFMQSQPGFLRYARDFMAQRRPRDQDTDLARLYALESTPGITGASADHRYTMDWFQVDHAARQLARALGLEVSAPPKNPLQSRQVEAIVADLRRQEGAALVVPGDQQPPAVHMLAHAMNEALGASGTLVEWTSPVPADVDAPGLAELTRAVQAGEVDSLLVIGANPVYTAPADLAFAEAYRRIPWRLHWGTDYDETGRLSHWHIPAAHFLESWGDARAYDGTISLVQPLIRPLHGGRTALQMWAAIERGHEGDPRDLLMDYWRSRYAGADFEGFWRRSLHDGVVADSRLPARRPVLEPAWTQQLPEAVPAPEGNLVLQLRPDPALWDGRYANNGWLQEMPRPLTTLTWHNAALISPALADRHGLEDGDLVELGVSDTTLEVPVFVLPGQPPEAITLALGHGRPHGGHIAEGIGSNAYALMTSGSPWAVAVTLQPTGGHRKLAAIQNHHHMEGRDLIREASLDQYRDDPSFASHEHEELSLYPEPWPAERQSDQAWGMVIDLSACIGCNGCVTACQSENNIPVVGPEEVARGHDMHWIRVDRYFSGTPDAPGITFQPVPCMHCENAPCEYVCPVGATQHSADGLNQMIYQRCVGTRYCSQNCPYKVRRFNWFDYTSAAAAYPAEPEIQNPDVTVRSRGVMEKCTYCVQRINTVRQQAETEQRPIRDGELQTACQQACPTSAIVFGDVADEASGVSRLRAHPLNYSLLEHLNTRARTTYLAAVHNPNPDLADEEADS